MTYILRCFCLVNIYFVLYSNQLLPYKSIKYVVIMCRWTPQGRSSHSTRRVGAKRPERTLYGSAPLSGVLSEFLYVQGILMTKYLEGQRVAISVGELGIP
jgi:hypothetical protein